jgi:hypothetical protein
VNGVTQPKEATPHEVGETIMRYIVAWLLGVPFSVIVVWYILAHSGCGS